MSGLAVDASQPKPPLTPYLSPWCLTGILLELQLDGAWI